MLPDVDNKYPVVNSKLKMSPFVLLFNNHFISLDPDKYLHTQSFYFLLVPNLGYISPDSWYELQSQDWYQCQ